MAAMRDSRVPTGAVISGRFSSNFFAKITIISPVGENDKLFSIFVILFYISDFIAGI